MMTEDAVYLASTGIHARLKAYAAELHLFSNKYLKQPHSRDDMFSRKILS